MELIDAVQGRRAVKSYDPNYKMSEDEIKRLGAEYADLEEIWKAEKGAVLGAAQLKEEIEKVRAEIAKLQREGKKLASDFSIINYAIENKMVIVTKDTEFRKASEENDFPLILLDDDEILKIIIEKLKEFN